MPQTLERTGSEGTTAALCASWADFSRRLQTGIDVRTRHGRVEIRHCSLARVAARFEIFRERYEEGDRSAVIDGVVYASRENVPLPYWLADAFRSSIAILDKRPANLHEVFGMGRRFPTTPKRWAKARLDRQTKKRLYVVARRLIARGMGKVAAIEKACDALPIRFRTAWAWFGEIDAMRKRMRAPGMPRLQRCAESLAITTGDTCKGI